ncbi:MAG: hypothetical protein WA981_10290 [Glaciecola sp.]
MKKLVIACVVLSSLSACTSLNLKQEVADGVFEKVTGKEMSRNASKCVAIKRSCSNGNYQEWTQNNGQKGCACN